MPVLQAVQEAVGCLPPAVQDRIAAGLNVPGSDIFGVMSFYSMYTWRPKGKYVIRFCESPPCHILDSDNLLEFTRAELGVPLNHTTKDGLFTLEKTACLGVCEVAPAMQINEVVHGNLTKDKIKQILADYRAGKAPDYKKLPYSTNDFQSYKQSPAELVLLSNVGVIDPEKIDDYVAKGGYSALKKVVTSMTPEAVVEEVKASGIRGRGGAGFPAGMKWSFTRPLDVPQKYLICNLDEGEPGTIKDRYIVEGDPQKLLEGMAIAGFAVGASKGFIYSRGEYYLCKHRLNTAIEQARAKGYVGEQPLRAPPFPLTSKCVPVSAAISAARKPRSSSPSKGNGATPVPNRLSRGWRGCGMKPTVVNNVETLASVPAIITKGGAWYKSLGTADTSGTKIYQIIGHVKTPQIVEVPVGITLRELIDTYGGGMKNGKKFKMCQTGGASAGIVTAEALDVPIDFGMAKVGGALGSGTMLVMDESVCAVDFARSVAVFFAHESCGQCTPCREGTPQLLKTLTRIWQGEGKPGDLEFLESLGQTLMDASFCPLGQTAPSPLLSLLKHFRQEFEDHISGKCKQGCVRWIRWRSFAEISQLNQRKRADDICPFLF